MDDARNAFAPSVGLCLRSEMATRGWNASCRLIIVIVLVLVRILVLVIVLIIDFALVLVIVLIIRLW